MATTRSPRAISVLLVLVTLALTARSTFAADESRIIRDAIQRFDQRDYLGAQELLLGLDQAQLSKDEQTLRADYLTRIQVALTMSEKAIRDLEDAETAIAARELDQAEMLLNAVLSNDYAEARLRQVATSRLREVAEAKQPRASQPSETTTTPPAQPAAAVTQPKESAPPAPIVQAQAEQTPPRPSPIDLQRAMTLVAEADAAVKASQFADARRLYEEALTLVPGLPEATAGLERVRQHEEVQAGPLGDSIAERLRRFNAINWQRAVAEYRDLERRIQSHVEANEYEQAQQLLVAARQVVESGRQFAATVSEYEQLRAELDGLAEFVDRREREYNAATVAQIRQEVETQRSERLRQIEESRARQVEALMEQANRHRKDGELREAVEILRQVTIIDPKNQPARWMMDALEDQAQYRSERGIRDDISRQTREALYDVEEAKIPWHQLLKYPNDWAEIISRPERRLPGTTRRDSQLWSALDRPVPVDFNRTPLNEAIEQLAEANKLNVIVNWNDLARAGVERNVPVDLSLPKEISLKKALTEMLDQAGGDSELGFEAADGVITVATRKFLNEKTYPVVYDINDLLMKIPRMDDAPKTDLRNAKIQQVEQPGTAQQPWDVGDDDDDEAEEDPRRTERVAQIVNLIQETIDPESWRERGGTIGSIKEINGQLVVTQNTAAQRRIGDLLSKLREERAIQIAVEAVFITVSSHFLEELGFNVNLVLNGGNAQYDFVPQGSNPAVDPVLGNRVLLPRTFSRLGFTPNTPALGTATTRDPNVAPTPQPFGDTTFVPQRTGGGGRRLTPIPVVNNILDFTNPANLPSDIPGSFGGTDVGPALSVFGSFLDNIQVDFLLRATQADSRTSVLTAPRVVVFNGNGAWVAVTIQQNFVSTLNPVIAQGAVAQQPIIGTVDAGAVLNIQTAVVTADKRYVMMILNPGVTRLIDLQTFPFSGGSGALNAFVQLPTLSSLRLQTAVSIPDGGTLLVGGQKLASESEVEAGVPVLSKIPILKRAYSSRTMVKDEQTLLILVKPKILIHSEQEELAFPSFARTQ